MNSVPGAMETKKCIISKLVQTRAMRETFILCAPGTTLKEVKKMLFNLVLNICIVVPMMGKSQHFSLISEFILNFC